MGAITPHVAIECGIPQGHLQLIAIVGEHTPVTSSQIGKNRRSSNFGLNIFIRQSAIGRRPGLIQTRKHRLMRFYQPFNGDLGKRNAQRLCDLPCGPLSPHCCKRVGALTAQTLSLPKAATSKQATTALSMPPTEPDDKGWIVLPAQHLTQIAKADTIAWYF